MKTLLICPDEVLAVRALTQNNPPAAVSILGKPLIAYWIEHLVALGAQEVLILSSDRPHTIREIVQDGCPWGIKIEVLSQRREPSMEEARGKFVAAPEQWLAPPYDAVLIGGLPNKPSPMLFETFENYFTAVRSWLPHAIKNRVHMKERKPAVWISSRSHVPNSVTIKAPCWIGDNVRISDGAIIGPMAILEENVVIGKNALIAYSIVKPDTYVGELTDIEDSIATGNLLINWKTNSLVCVPDAFLVSALDATRQKSSASTIAGRLIAGAVALVMTPLVLPFAFRSLIRGTPLFSRYVAVARNHTGFINYYQLRDTKGYFARWPELWNVILGEFSWFGNRPLSVRECAEMSIEFETLWLEAPIGIFSQADAAGCWNSQSDDAAGHASFYSVQRHWRLNFSILMRVVSNWYAASRYNSTPAKTKSIKEKLFSLGRTVSAFFLL